MIEIIYKVTYAGNAEPLPILKCKESLMLEYWGNFCHKHTLL